MQLFAFRRKILIGYRTSGMPFLGTLELGRKNRAQLDQSGG